MKSEGIHTPVVTRHLQHGPIDRGAFCGHSEPQSREEIFGLGFSALTVDDAIALANNIDGGLAESIFTASVKKALRGARAIDARRVPTGGFKSSEFGDCDNGIHLHDQYTRIKTIWVWVANDRDQAML